MSEYQPPVLGITLGDVNGVGPELALKTLSEPDLLNHFTPVLYGPAKALQFYRNLLEYTKFHFGTISSAAKVHPGKINVVDSAPDFETIEPGVPSIDTGLIAFRALERAVQDLKGGYIQALVTLPIDKSTVQNPEFTHPGHTEYLAQKFDAKEPLMLMVHEELRVAVATGHIPLKDVANALNPDKLYRKLALFYDTLRFDFGIERPRLAVLGLNPHAGDNGLIGREDIEIVKRAVDRMANERKHVYGPYSADSFFIRQYKQFDGVLAMYHDQGLIPFKSLSQGDGVNFTGGLRAVRTSPDHGTAYDIAGQGKADETSFRNAIYLALDTLKHRNLSTELREEALRNSPVSSFYLGFESPIVPGTSEQPAPPAPPAAPASPAAPTNG